MPLVRWDPFRGEPQSWAPAIDVVETDEAIVLKAELAGMRPEDISIEMQDNVLTLSGDRKFEEEVKDDRFYRIERRYGSFSRSLALPPTADESKVDARYENGLLQVTVRKTEIVKPKKITVTIGSAQKIAEATAIGQA
jgi:HSP20 family protein